MLREEPVELICRDGVRLGGHFWPADGGSPQGAVVINAATGVLARYYHRYARFLSGHGFSVLTYDYRGIGASRPETLRGCSYRWADWGMLDFDAALRFMDRQVKDTPRLVVGHSIGGFLPGLAASAPAISRILTVGAQYAYWRDYEAHQRWRLFLKWHVTMPLLTALCGYFPGRRLGWLEDLPAGVANEWSFRRSRMELSLPPQEREVVLKRLASVTAPILAVIVGDDEFGTPAAVRRGLSYYRHAPVTEALLTPERLGLPRIGHFDLFHSRHERGFWADSLQWLGHGANPWPEMEGSAPSGKLEAPARQPTSPEERIHASACQPSGSLL
jgi:predicted alpha/beta hydrolase